MNKIYTRINWENYPSEATALNETNLNKMDFALDEVDNRLIKQDTTKLSKTDASNDVVNWTMDEETGVITVTRRSGEQILFDLNIEKIPVSFSLSDDGILTMVTDDGTTFTANIGAMIPVLTFNDSDEISVSISGTGINKTYSFSVKDNSITENKLQPNFLADIKVQSASASLSASNAETNATKSQSYAVGGTGTRGENEDTDNAKYYNEQAQKALSEMQKSQVTGVKGNNETNFRTGNVNLTSDDVGSVAVGGDVAENTVTYESSDVGPDGVPSLISLEKFTTGEKLSSLIKKTSIIANNFRYFLKLLGNTDISSIGDGTVTGGLVSLNDSLNGIQELKHIQLPNGLGVLFQQKIGDIVYCTLKAFNALIYQVNIGTTLGTLDIPPQSYITFYLIGSDGNKYRCGTDGYGNISNAEVLPPNIWYSCSFSYYIGS